MRAAATARSARPFSKASTDAWAVLVGVALGCCALAAGSSDAGLQRLAVLLVFAPLAEEVVFRAGLQEALLRGGLRPLLANALTALTFGAAHVAVRGEAAALAVVGPALLIGAVYSRGRRLWPCVALHVALNGVWLAWALAGPTARFHF